METPSCWNVTGVTIAGPTVSSPMPVIGLYIAAASLVCFLFMLCDVVHGLHRRKPWLPCRFFSLNSLTLTLLAIATKLPVDLTTSMPSALDQLSKLSATILLCISMSFFLPSLGTQGDSEWLPNMASLSVLVVTVIVNVCIQITTGVIFSFFVEHVIIMFCMLLILIILWTSNLGYGLLSNSNFTDKILEPLKKSDQGSSTRMMDRLKSVYKKSYFFDPELMLSGSPNSITVGMLSTVSTLVLLEATIGSLVLKEAKFECGISDYKWSIWMVVGAQILTVLLGGIAIGYRWVTSVRHFHMDLFPIIICSTDEVIRENYVVFSHVKKIHMMSIFKFSRLGFVNVFLNMVKKMFIVLQTVIDIIAQVVTFLSLKMRIYLARMVKFTKNCSCMVRNGEEREELDFDKWINEKSTKDINDRIEKYTRDSSTHLIQILANTCDHQELPISLLKEDVSRLLVIIILIRMTKVLLPDSLSASLFNALGEAFEIICFVEEKRNELDPWIIKVKSLVAKDVWMNKDNTNHWFNKKFIKLLVKSSIGIGGRSESQLDLNRALRIIEEFNEVVSDEFYPELFAGDELEIICKFIIARQAEQPYTSISDLYDHLKQLFVGMLNFYLSQLPLAIFRHVVESSNIEQYEERARLGIKFICKVKPLVGKVNWSFPDGTGITSLINDDEDVVLSSSPTTTHHIQPELVGDGEIQEHV